MRYNIFDSLEEAQEAQKYDFEGYEGGAFANDLGYWNTLSLYPEITQLADGKWIYPVVSHSDAKHETMEF